MKTLEKIERYRQDRIKKEMEELELNNLLYQKVEKQEREKQQALFEK